MNMESGGMNTAAAASVEVAEPAASSPQMSGDVAERSFSTDEKISLYNNHNEIADETQSIAAGFNDPESTPRSASGPAALSSVSERAFTDTEKSALASTKSFDATQGIAAEFSDPESVLTAPPKPAASPETMKAPEKIEITPEETAHKEEEKKAATELRSYVHDQKIKTVRKEVVAAYEGRTLSPEELVMEPFQQSARLDSSKVTESTEKNLGTDGPNSPRNPQKNIEQGGLQKNVASVVYHLESSGNILDTKIALINWDGGWNLSSRIADPNLDEEAEAARMVKEETGYTPKKTEKMSSEIRGSYKNEDGSTYELEDNYFMTEAPVAEDTVIASGKELKWFTARDILSGAVPLPDEAKKHIEEALKRLVK